MLEASTASLHSLTQAGMRTMSTEHMSGKGYTALRQSVSNTDTEDEDEDDNVARTLDNISKGADRNTETNTVYDKGCFYPLDETRNVANRGKNCRKMLGYCNNDIPIMVIDGDSHLDLWKRREMSLLRRLCLAISILLCVATVLIFLYALPCDNEVTCLVISEQQSPLTWDKTLQGVELHGPISVIPGSPDSLIFLLRGQHYGVNSSGSLKQQQIPSEGGGVLSVQGVSGTPLWWVTLKRLPLEIDCFALDTDGSGKPDCIVAGEKGLLVSIEPTTGMIHWSSAIHTYSKLPVLLPDIDSDGIDDLLSVEIMAESILGLVLLSGRNGQVVGRPLTRDCSSIQIISFNSNVTVSYSCDETNGKRSTKSVPLKELLDTVNSSQVGKKLTSKSQTSLRGFTVSNHDANMYNWELTPFHRLSIQNRETHPDEFYQANINLTLHKVANESHLIWSHVNPNSFAMEPAILTMTGYPYMTGFVIKFWQWPHNEQPERINSSLIKRRLTERVQIVLMNCTEVHTINASQIEIVQLCRDGDCQPSLHLQTRSVAIVDLNRDGTRELISYRSSYDLEKSQILTSQIQIVKLNMEVSKLTQQNVD
ncbi:uncharacterized protein LOC107272793 isoform X2 [Cephus cinctus]|uniref:Uncharacterized protein LOC107272793 isoform X2 n=1 Tax=Cephus cinctus TaxID=211228 RepID=A0AAJ7RS88_CEPCN|nr:uncharacterized protein LOC107272793 isoform X2 [Cephus cinctus]